MKDWINQCAILYIIKHNLFFWINILQLIWIEICDSLLKRPPLSIVQYLITSNVVIMTCFGTSLSWGPLMHLLTACLVCIWTILKLVWNQWFCLSKAMRTVLKWVDKVSDRDKQEQGYLLLIITFLQYFMYILLYNFS